MQDVTFSDIFSTLWKRRGFIFFTSLIFFILGLAYLVFSTQKFQASITLTESVNPINSKSLTSNAAGGFSAVFSELQQKDNLYSQYENIIRTRTFIQSLDQEVNLRKEYFVYDAEKEKFFFPSTLTFLIKKVIGVVIFKPLSNEPDIIDLQGIFEKNIDFIVNKKNNTLTIQYYHQDREYAVSTLIKINELVDKKLTALKLQEANRIQQYLSNAIKNIDSLETRAALYNMQNQINLDLAKLYSNAAYSLLVIDPVYAAINPTKPRPVQTIFLALAVGIFFSFSMSLCAPSFFKNRKKQNA